MSIGGLESLRNCSKSSGFGFCRLVTAAAIESAQCVGSALVLGCSRGYCGIVRCCCSCSIISKSICVSVLLEFVSAFRNRVGGTCRDVGSGGCGRDARSGYGILVCCRVDSSLSDCSNLCDLSLHFRELLSYILEVVLDSASNMRYYLGSLELT